MDTFGTTHTLVVLLFCAVICRRAQFGSRPTGRPLPVRLVVRADVAPIDVVQGLAF